LLAGVNADPTQRSREGDPLPDHCQGGFGSAAGDEPDIAGNIYACGAGIVAWVGELYGFPAPYVCAHAHTALAKDAQVMVSNKERAVRPNRQFLGDVRWEFLQADVVHCPLQLAVAVLGTEDAPVLNGYVAEANIEGTAPLAPVAGETGIGMPAQDRRHVFVSLLLNPRRFGFDDHPFGDGCSAGQGQLSIHFRQTKLTVPVRYYFGQRFKTGVRTQGWNVDSGLCRGFENGCPFFGLKRLSVYGKGNVTHITPLFIEAPVVLPGLTLHLYCTDIRNPGPRGQ